MKIKMIKIILMWESWCNKFNGLSSFFLFLLSFFLFLLFLYFFMREKELGDRKVCETFPPSIWRLFSSFSKVTNVPSLHLFMWIFPNSFSFWKYQRRESIKGESGGSGECCPADCLWLSTAFDLFIRWLLFCPFSQPFLSHSLLSLSLPSSSLSLSQPCPNENHSSRSVLSLSPFLYTHNQDQCSLGQFFDTFRPELILSGQNWYLHTILALRKWEAYRKRVKSILIWFSSLDGVSGQ